MRHRPHQAGLLPLPAPVTGPKRGRLAAVVNASLPVHFVSCQSAIMTTNPPKPSLEPLEGRYLLSTLPVGPEFQINENSSDGSPAVAMAPSGDFVIAWQSGNQIKLRQYSAAGGPRGNEFFASNTSTSQFRPAVAMDSNGNFLVAWEERFLPGPNGGFDRDAIVARRFDASGEPIGADIHVNQYTPYRQVNPAVAMDADGDFVVTWQSESQPGGDINDVMARRYTAAGQPLGDEFMVNQTTFYRQQDADVVMGPSGDFGIAWVSYSGTGSGGIVLRKYNADGVPASDEIVVSFSGAVFAPRIARLVGGGLVLTYAAVIGGQAVIAARMYDADLSPLGPQLEVSAAGAHDVAADGSGGFIVARDTNTGEDPPRDIYVQGFDVEGMPVEEPLRANTTTDVTNSLPAIAVNIDGDYVVTWLSNVPTPGASINNVLGRRFAHPPTASESSFEYNAQTQQFAFTFSENVSASLSPSDLELVNLTTGQTIDPSKIALAWNSATFTATFTFPGFPRGILPDGNYRATIAASDVTDPGGNAMQQDAVLEFFVLAGDANRDAKVNQQDLLILASNWQASPRTFSQGDFNYDTVVDITDLGILATNWQKNLPLPALARGLLAVGARPIAGRLIEQIDTL